MQIYYSPKAIRVFTLPLIPLTDIYLHNTVTQANTKTLTEILIKICSDKYLNNYIKRSSVQTSN